MQPLVVNAGETIFRTGDPSHAVYIIDSGEVSITVGDGIEVARLHGGALFGESGVLEARARAATATAITEAHLLVTEAEAFLQAFGMENERALALVKLLCQRLRDTTLRSAQLGHEPLPNQGSPRLLLYADHPRLAAEHGMAAPVEVRYLPFQVGNRFGGEVIPIASNHSCCIAAHGQSDLGAPHFEILRRDGRVGVHDLGTAKGTIVNGMVLKRTSLTVFAPLHAGNNEVIAGGLASPFRFRLQLLTG